MKELFTLGELYVSDFLKEGEQPRGPKTELKLMLEEDTGAVRLEKTAPLDTMFGAYWYRSSINSSMREALSDVVNSIMKRVNLKTGNVWIDLAANDGCLLSFLPDWLIKIGIDPADDSFKRESEQHADLIIQDYFTAKSFKESKFGKLKANVITTIAMFYDIDDPKSFINDVKEVLDDDGVWVLQLSYTPLMLKQLAFDNMCFKPETRIMGANKPISELITGDKVLDLNGEYTQVKNVFNRDYNGDLIKIKAEYLDNIESTPEHPFLVVKKENIDNQTMEWVEAKNLRTEDFLVIPKIKTKDINRTVCLKEFNQIDSPNHRRGLYEIELTDDFLWVMGLYLAEGHISGPPTNLHINFTLHIDEQEYAEKIKNTFEIIGYKTRIYNSKVSKSMVVQVSCTAIARIFEYWFNKGAINKRIPDFLFTSKPEIAVPFLNGLFDGDGFKNNEIGLHLASRTLIDQVQLMLATLNALTGLSYVKPYVTEIRGDIVKSKDSWQLRGKNKYLDNIFSSDYDKARSSLRYKLSDTHLFTPIKEITSFPYSGKVYNIETETSTYVVSNAVVHNCHEHVYYYSLFNLKKILNDCDMQILDVELNDVNGGSYRIYVMKNNANTTKFGTQPQRDVGKFRVESLLEYEYGLGLDQVDTWKDFHKRIDELKYTTVSFIRSVIDDGKTVYGYGGSTKGNTLLQYFELDNTLITAIAERSPYKFGLRTVGTDIPIISEEEMRKAKPDYLLVLPWHFINEFKEREREFLDGGGHFIVPCPKFEVIGKE